MRKKDTFFSQIRSTYKNKIWRGSRFASAGNSTDIMLEASHDAIMIFDTNGMILFANESTVDIFGWDRRELVRENITKVFGVTFTIDYFLDLFENIGDEHSKKLNLMKRIKLTTATKDERNISIMVNVTRRKSENENVEFFAFIKITSQVDRSDSIRSTSNIVSIIEEKVLDNSTNSQMDDFKRTQDFFETVTKGFIDASIDGMLSIDDEGEIIMVNKSACTLFDIAEDEFIGKNFIEIIDEGSRKDYFSMYRSRDNRRLVACERELKAIKKNNFVFSIILGLSEIKIDTSSIFATYIRDISNEKEQKIELKKKEILTWNILDLSADALITFDEDGMIQMVNNAAIEKFGWTPDVIIGSNLELILSDEGSKDLGDYLANSFGLHEKEERNVVLSAKRKDGNFFPIELSISEINIEMENEKLFCGVIRELTRGNEANIEILRKKLVPMEASFDAIFSIDLDGTILMVNKIGCTKFGWRKEELIGSNITTIMEGEESMYLDKYLDPYLHKVKKKLNTTQQELTARRKDGSSFPVMFGISEIQVGDFVNYVATVRDLSNEKKLVQVEAEKCHAEALLRKLLPQNIAERLKVDHSHFADHYSCATILFADIVGFTELSSTLAPIQLVRLLDNLFSRFDALLDVFELNKVKTIGDCYMVTSMPAKNNQFESCLSVCNFALEMLSELEDFNLDHPGYNLKLRVGINIGPVVAGIVGTDRFFYDLWGDAVNVASRMESTGVPGKIQVTTDIVNHADHAFEFEERGKIMVKGKGETHTFFLVGTNEEYKGSETDSFDDLSKQRRLSRDLRASRKLSCKSRLFASAKSA